MSGADTLESVGRQLRVATSFISIFGTLPDGAISKQQSALRRQFRQLVLMVHPDHVEKHLAVEAADVFRQLTDIRHAAERAINVGTYGKPFTAGAFSNASSKGSPKQSVSEITSPLHTYHLFSTPYKTGDFSVIYRAKVIGGTGGEVLVKVSSQPSFNGWLASEAKILSRFRDAGASDPLSKIAQFVPKLVESFFMNGPNGTRYAVNVLAYVDGLVSVADIMRAYPKGVDPEHAGWIFRRIIAQTIAADMAGVVHSAITPDHVLVDPIKREPLHIGWAHAIEDPTHSHLRVMHVIDRWKDFYPKEVLRKEEPDRRTDLFMAGKMMIALLGGNTATNTIPSAVPSSVSAVVLRTVKDSRGERFQTGQELLDEFTRVIRKEWGRGYRPLPMQS